MESLRMADISSPGVMPSGLLSLTPALTCSRMPDTRIMKNSSIFELKIDRNFRRSNSGLRSSSASSSTRLLNSSRLNSRLKYWLGFSSGWWITSTGEPSSATISSTLIGIRLSLPDSPYAVTHEYRRWTMDDGRWTMESPPKCILNLTLPPDTQYNAAVHGPSSMVHRPWSIVHGPSSMVHGPWSMVHRPWSIVHGPSSMVHRPWSIVHGPSS